MRIKFYKRPPTTPPNFYYRSGEVTKVTKMTPKTRKSADQRNNLIPELIQYRICNVSIMYVSIMDTTD